MRLADFRVSPQAPPLRLSRSIAWLLNPAGGQGTPHPGVVQVSPPRPKPQTAVEVPGGMVLSAPSAPSPASSLEPLVVGHSTAPRDKARRRQKPTAKPRRKRHHFPCPHCPKVFSQPCWLLRHERTHTGERPFVCPHPGCGKTFPRSDRITTHLRTHTGERPYPCEHCDKAFAQAGDLRRHYKSHREIVKS